ncbi:four-carbon acid sugar kinase family protein [Actinacidiphila oryziradicis]|uniref:Four-carbon acid sugar kinase family protein n=1 Tax=Actinacidiphila oryziradicis TaxID=2571141 RepID=A0A4U0RLB8_9ACTN|nr:four-carbon acid sugar kinase family protein [Actinacidiphila oryziradicis]TJZ96096.1 four-carbon acid sugar kinase family protein [Actinacidiphila oryziradicis]
MSVPIEQRAAAASEPAVLIIADDLSGAADSAVALADRADAVVLLDAEAPLPRATVVSVDTDSRYADPAAAAARVTAAVRRSDVGTLVYKKIDSTLRGNIGPEIHGCLTALDALHGRNHLAVVAPAFPATGRTVVDGRVLVAGERVELRHPGRVPLVEQLRAAGLTVRLLGLRELRAGDAAGVLADAAGADAVVVDAVVDDDLARAVSACDGLPVLLAGSAGLAHHLALVDGGARTAPAAAQRPYGPVLIVVGSRSEQAYAQCRTLATELPAVPVAVTTANGGTERAARQLVSALSAGRDAVVFLDPSLAVEPSRAQEFARALANVARIGADDAGTLIATGGETARAVLLAMGVCSLTVEGEIEPGVARAHTTGGLTVITKAGAFGDRGTLLRAARELGHGSLPYTPTAGSAPREQWRATGPGTLAAAPPQR